jgi:hypothetical protein
MARILVAGVALIVLPLLPTLGTVVADADDNRPAEKQKAPRQNRPCAPIARGRASSGDVLPLPAADGSCQCSAFSPDGKWLVTGYAASRRQKCALGT